MRPAAPALLALAATLLLLACKGDDLAASASETDPNAIKLGLLSPVTGWAPFGVSSEKAARFAALEINAAGGLDGRPIAFILADGGCSGSIAPEGARYLLSQGVVAILGEGCSAATLAAAKAVCIPAGIPLISAGSTSPLITTELGPSGLCFRTAPSDAFQGEILARKAWEAGVTTMAVVFTDNAYGRGLAQVFKTAFQGKGGTVTAFVPYPDGKSIGFTEEVDALFAPSVPEGLLLVTYEIDGANLTRDLKLRAPLPFPRLFGVDGNKGATFLVNAEPTVIEGMVGTLPSAPTQDPNFQRFRQAYFAATRDGEEPDDYGENVYDAAYLLAYAMAAGGPTPAGIAANLPGISRPDGSTPTIINVGEWQKGVAALRAGQDVDYQGASGRIDLDANGDPSSGTYALWRIRNGKYEIVEEISFP